jgi:hypothetical protein
MIHKGETALRLIIALCSSQLILRNRCSVILRNSSFTLTIQLAERQLPVLAVSSALARANASDRAASLAHPKPNK